MGVSAAHPGLCINNTFSASFYPLYIPGKGVGADFPRIPKKLAGVLASGNQKFFLVYGLPELHRFRTLGRAGECSCGTAHVSALPSKIVELPIRVPIEPPVP